MMQKDDMNNIFKTVLVEAHVHISFHKKRIVIKAHHVILYSFVKCR